jgi:hypothetical protein
MCVRVSERERERERELLVREFVRLSKMWLLWGKHLFSNQYNWIQFSDKSGCNHDNVRLGCFERKKVEHFFARNMKNYIFLIVNYDSS